MFTLELDTSLYPALHEPISNTESQNNILWHEIEENGKWTIIFLEENMSSDSFDVIYGKNTSKFGRFWIDQQTISQ